MIKFIEITTCTNITDEKTYRRETINIDAIHKFYTNPERNTKGNTVIEYSKYTITGHIYIVESYEEIQEKLQILNLLPVWPDDIST